MVPSSSHADLISTTLGALELVSSLATKASTTGGEKTSFSIVKTGDLTGTPAAIADTADSFTATADAYQTIHLNTALGATSHPPAITTTWDASFMDTKYFGLLSIGATLTTALDSESYNFGGGGASASGSITIDVNGLSQAINWQKNASFSASVSTSSPCSGGFLPSFSCIETGGFTTYGSDADISVSAGDMIEIVGSVTSNVGGSVSDGSTIETADSSLSFTLAAVPEPSSMALLGIGVVALRLINRKRTLPAP
jgi:hypothetical protein